jgi:DNA repair exonuclease SbcCD ATPase subunit
MANFENYYEKVEAEAKSFVDDYIDEIYTEVEENGVDDLYDFVNDYRLHEWVDSDFIYVGLIESANIIEQSNNVETDSGLWEGLEPTKAIETQAFYTYRNDMSIEIMDIIKSELQDRQSELETDLEKLQEELEEVEEDLNIIGKDSTIERLENEIEELEDRISNLESAIDNI